MSQKEKVELPKDINQRTKDIALPNKKSQKKSLSLKKERTMLIQYQNNLKENVHGRKKK